MYLRDTLGFVLTIEERRVVTPESLIAELRITATDRSSASPLHHIVAARLQRIIETGQVPVGSRLENEIDLAERLGISRPTMRRAMQHLVDRGMVVRRPGFGTQVVNPTVRRPIELTSLFDDLAKTGRQPKTEVLSMNVIPADDAMSAALRIPPRSEVTAIERLRYANGEPLALMYNVIPAQIARFDVRDLEKRGLYEILRSASALPQTANEVIGARVATAAEARILGEKRGAPLLTMTRTAWNAAGQGIEYGSHVYRADRYAFELTVSGA
jgi:DNA-binding GntR family transcriptional regulator